MATKLKILVVIGLIAAGLLYADSHWRRRYGMSFRTVDWSVKTGGHRFGIAEYSMRGVEYALHGQGRPFYPDLRNSVVYLGPAGSFRARPFLIVSAAVALSLGVLLVRRENQISQMS